MEGRHTLGHAAEGEAGSDDRLGCWDVHVCTWFVEDESVSEFIRELELSYCCYLEK